MMASMVGTGGGVRGGVIKNAGVTVGVRRSGGAVGKSGTVNFPWLAVVGVELAACETRRGDSEKSAVGMPTQMTLMPSHK